MYLTSDSMGWRQAVLLALASGAVWVAFLSHGHEWDGWGDVLMQGVFAFLGVTVFSVIAYISYLMVSKFILHKTDGEGVRTDDALPFIYSILLAVCVFKILGDARVQTTTYQVRTKGGEVVECVYTEPLSEPY